MTLPLGETYHYGVMTRFPSIEATRATTAKLDALEYDTVWVGDHIAFTTPILDPFLQLSQIAACSDRLIVGTGVFLLPLRHPTPVAKQTATMDHLTGGRFIFGVGVGGEFPREFEACGIPHNERGARLEEGVEVIRKLWRGAPVAHEGRFFSFSEVHMQPATLRPAGPPIWFGGRSDRALDRIGRIGDGWISYVVTPEMYKAGLDRIAPSFEAANRDLDSFGTAHLLFTQIDESYEAALKRAIELLSKRYAMDFTGPAKKYAAIGRPEDVAEAVSRFHEAGVRHVNFDFLGPPEARDEQMERFAKEVRPLLGKG